MPPVVSVEVPKAIERAFAWLNRKLEMVASAAKVVFTPAATSALPDKALAVVAV